MKIAHILNPIKVSENNELYLAQQVTFETLNRALNWYYEGFDVKVYSTQFEEDNEIVPDHITSLSNLKRSILDINPKLSGRKLPLIADILEKTNEIDDYDYLIYTNIDIALMPNFYTFVASELKKGHDAIVINRRRITNRYQFPHEIDKMYADLGRSHPGFDCFVVKKELLENFLFDKICIGTPFFEVSFIHNIASFSNKPLYVFNAHLTFHLGTEVLSKRIKDETYWHNRVTYFTKIKPKLASHFRLSKFPYYNHNFPIRSIKWFLNPSIFTRDYLRLEGKNVVQKLINFLREFRWIILQR